MESAFCFWRQSLSVSAQFSPLNLISTDGVSINHQNITVSAATLFCGNPQKKVAEVGVAIAALHDIQ